MDYTGEGEITFGFFDISHRSHVDLTADGNSVIARNLKQGRQNILHSGNPKNLHKCFIWSIFLRIELCHLT